MQFSELAQYFEKLESTSSRLALIDILAELFKKVNKEEIDKVMYLAQGRIAPFFAPVEIGMADKNVASAMAMAYESDKEAVLKQYSKLGDMGLVALQLSEKFKPARNATQSVAGGAKSSKLTIVEVFDVLTQIAKTTGEGSVEKKQILLADLLKKMDPTAAKHLVRVPLGNTRLGIGDPTILDGLALAILGDRSNRKLLERAYNETSDLGLIGIKLLEGGLKAVKKLSVTVGRPIRSELCERLPNVEKVLEKMGGKVHSTLKYDGIRVQLHKDGDKVHMYSRNLEDMTHMFPELIEGTKRQVKAKTAILDTEALAYQPESEEFLPFQETTKRRRKHNIEEVAKQLPLKAFVFDILYVDGKSLIDTPLLQRIEILKKTVKTDDTLIPSPGEIVSDPKKLQIMLDDAITKGLEGLVVKRVDSLYEAGGRNFNWVKLKRHSSGELHDTIDCVILGYIFGRGKRTAFGAGALLVGIYDKENDAFVTVSRIGTGLSDEEWRSIKEKTKGLEIDHKPARVNSLITPDVWVKPEIVIEVLADEITISPRHTAGMDLTDGAKGLGYALRFPRLIRFREKDKKPEDATTVKELIEMFKSQGKK
ncbi:MAG: ATP-dependent DNA ligase [Candidatus Levybacteria bacterium]|nr:ATP-dependent DNA ligase [Candidatus Levybacteria bacterium]